MKEFFNGPYFFPTMVVLLLALFLVVVWTILSGKKKNKKVEIEEQKVVEEVVTTVPTTKDIEEVKKEIEAKEQATVLENTSPEVGLPEVKEEVVETAAEETPVEETPVEETPVEENTEVVEEKVEEPVVEYQPRTEIAPDAPTIDIPINEMDSSEVTVEKTEVVEEQPEPTVEVPKIEELVETETEAEKIEIEFSKPLPYDIFVVTPGDENGDSVNFSIFAGTTYYSFYKNDRVWYSFDQPIRVTYFNPYDVNYRIIPTHIEAIMMPGNTYFDTGLGQYLYASNINYLPVSEDDIGSNSEVCPIIDLYDLQNTDQNVIWYNYNGEILFRDLYTGLIYALNSYGDLYQWN